MKGTAPSRCSKLSSSSSTGAAADWRARWRLSPSMGDCDDLADAERMRDDLRHQVRVGDGRERREVHASRELSPSARGHLEGQPGLADSARPGQRHQPHRVAQHDLLRLGDIGFACRRARCGEPAGWTRPAPRPRRRGWLHAACMASVSSSLCSSRVDSYRSAGFFARQRLSSHCSGSGASGCTSDQRRRFVAEDGGKFLHVRGPLEGAAAAQHLVDDDAERELVAAEIGGPARGLLRRHVADRPEDGAGLGRAAATPSSPACRRGPAASISRRRSREFSRGRRRSGRCSRA